MGKNCAICGKPSGMYPLCAECFRLRDEGKVLKCEECGVWHRKDSPCECAPKKAPKEEYTPADLLKHRKSEPIKEEVTSDLVCLACGDISYGKHFCPKCFHRFKGKVIYFKINEQGEFDFKGAYYEGHVSCLDGHIVKSKSEKIIDDYLFNNNIRHVYEKTIKYDDNGVTKDISPDFYLPDLKIYLEHWGFDESYQSYQNSKEYKIKVYNRLGLTVISTTEDDLRDAEANLEFKLKNYKEGQYND